MRLTVLCLLAFALLPPASRAQDVPVSEVTPLESTIKFGVEASVPIQGTFKKWDATLKYTSTAVESGVLDIKIYADSVDTGSGMKNGKLKGKDFFNVKEDLPEEDFGTIFGRQDSPSRLVAQDYLRHCYFTTVIPFIGWM